jgi:hypothetical protein
MLDPQCSISLAVVNELPSLPGLLISKAQRALTVLMLAAVIPHSADHWSPTFRPFCPQLCTHLSSPAPTQDSGWEGNDCPAPLVAQCGRPEPGASAQPAAGTLIHPSPRSAPWYDISFSWQL